MNANAEERQRRLRALDAAHVWHPFTQMQGWAEEDPLIVERGEGRHLIDVRGRRYLDGISALWCNVHGHRVPEIDDAIRAQLDRVAHTTLLGQASVPSIELAARLAGLRPGLKRVFFSDSGSTAVEVALKLAFQYWRLVGRPEKKLFVSLGEAYHGDTIGSVSLGASELFHSLFRPLLFERLVIPTPYGYRLPEGFDSPAAYEAHCIETAERLLAERGHEVAALVIEPLIQGAAGMITQPKGFLARLAAACKAHDVLLVCDEVATGFGRTGTMLAVEQEGVTPDLLCLAKGITGGYLPLAATLASERIYEAFLGPYEAMKTFFHGHTYTGNPLACAAALASLELFEKNAVLERLQPKIAYLRGRLARIAAHPHVGEVRQRGFMVGIELVRDRESKQGFGPKTRMGHRTILRARELGVILRPLGDVVVLMPPLAITDEELELLCDVTERSIDEATRSV